MVEGEEQCLPQQLASGEPMLQELPLQTPVNLSRLITSRACECATDPPPEPTGPFAEAFQLHERFRQSSDLEAANRSIEIYQTIATQCATQQGCSVHDQCQGDPIPDMVHFRCRRFHVLAQLAGVLQDKFRYTNDDDDLSSAIKNVQDALAQCLAEDVACPTVLMFYANILDSQSSRTLNPESREVAISVCRHAALVSTPDNPLRTNIIGLLGWITLMRFRDAGNQVYLEEALDLQRSAVSMVLPSQENDRHKYLRYLGYTLLLRYQATRNPEDLEQSVSASAEAFELCPITHIERSVVVRQMMDSLRLRCYNSGNIDDINRAIDIGRDALKAASTNSNIGDILREALGGMLILRHQITLSGGDDIEEAVQLLRVTFMRSLSGSMDQVARSVHLAISLRLLFLWDGDLGHLEEALELNRQAAGVLPYSDMRWFITAQELADSLSARFSEVGDASDLVEALEWDHRAIAAISPSHASYSSVVLNTISHLCLRYEIHHRLEDLEEAVVLSQELLEVLPDGHIDKFDTARRLAKALLLRGQHNSDALDIERAVHELVSWRYELSQTSAAQDCLRIITTCHLIKYRGSRDPSEMDRAMEMMKDASNITQRSQRERYQGIITAAMLHIERGTRYQDLCLALSYVQDALENNHIDVRSRLKESIAILDTIRAQHGDIIASEHPVPTQLLAIYRQTISLLPRTAFLGLHFRSRLQFKMSLPETAIEIIEQGRAVFWTHLSRLRSPFDPVPEGLRDRLSSLARQLERAENSSHTDDALGRRAAEAESAQRRRQCEEFNSLLEEIRGMSGLERFLLPDEYAALARAAYKGRSPGSPISIPLRKVEDSWLVESSFTWRVAVEDVRSILRDRLKISKVASQRPVPVRVNIVDILRSLWEKVVIPVRIIF